MELVYGNCKHFLFLQRLDSVDEPYICNGEREQDPSEILHQGFAPWLCLPLAVTCAICLCVGIYADS